jgi:hypothetical protein
VTRNIDRGNGCVEVLVPNIFVSYLQNILHSGKSALLISYLNLNNSEKGPALMRCVRNLEGSFGREFEKILMNEFYLDGEGGLGASEMGGDCKMLEEEICEARPVVEAEEEKFSSRIQQGSFGHFLKEELFHQVDAIYSRPLNALGLDKITTANKNLTENKFMAGFACQPQNQFLPFQGFSLFLNSQNTMAQPQDQNFDPSSLDELKFLDLDQRIVKLKEFNLLNNSMQKKLFNCDPKKSLQTFDIVKFYDDHKSKIISPQNFSKVLNKCIKKAILKTEDTIAHQLMDALAICFDLKKYFDTV